MKKLILSIAIILAVLSVQAQASWKYTPKVQSDSMNVYTYFKLNNEVVKFISPSNGQFLVRKLVSGKNIWTNETVNALGYDSIRFDVLDGYLRGYRSGVTNAASTTNLNGRFTIIQTFQDSIAALRALIPTDFMLKSIYDPGNVGGQIVNTATAQTLSNKTLTLPVIANYSNANHDHSTTVQGGLINSDNIVQGTVNLFSPFTESGGNIILPGGYLGIGKTPTAEVDILGTAKATTLDATNLILNGSSLTSVQLGTSDNNKIATKGYVDDQIIASSAYNDEAAQDAVGTILDNGTIGDVVFTYTDLTPKISADVEDDSHAHTGTTISGLAVADFTSPNISNWTNDANYVGSSFALTGDLTGTIASPAIASGVIVNADINAIAAIDASKIGAGLVSSTEYGYVDGVTSAIQTQLDGKVDENTAIAPSTKTKITYDAKGLVTAGANATAADIVNTPAGNIAGANVQLALNELDTEKIQTTYLDTDVTLAANSDTKIATQKATKTYTDAKVSDVVYGSGWDGVTTIAPSKNTVYDKVNSIERIDYSPASMAINKGTLIQGTVSNVTALGGSDLIVQEASGADPLRVTFTFTGVARMTSFSFYGHYEGDADDIVNVEIYNPTALTWHLLGQFSTHTSHNWYSVNIFSPTSYISSGSVQIRFNHTQTGNTLHTIKLDYINVNYGGAGGGSTVGASSVEFIPAGTIAATNVQAAIMELDDEFTPYGDHSALDSLEWTASAHTGTPNTYAAFDALGNATTATASPSYNTSLIYNPINKVISLIDGGGTVSDTLQHTITSHSDVYIPSTPATGTIMNYAGSFYTMSTATELGLLTESTDTLFTTIALSDETTALTAGTAVRTFRMPVACTITKVRANVNTAATGATIIVDINEGGVSILSTKLSIDVSETTSKTAATPYVISDSAIADDAEITVDIDQVGSTIAGKGLKLIIYYIKN